MFTGFPRTSTERIENVVINAITFLQVGLILLKAAGLTAWGWINIFVPSLTFVALLAVVWTGIRLYRMFLQARDMIDLMRFQRAQKQARSDNAKSV